MIGNGPAGLNNFGSNVTLSTFDNRVFREEVFSVSKRFTLAASGSPGDSIDVVIDPIENGPFLKNTFVFLPIAIGAIGSGPVDIDLYIGTDSDADGTLWESVNRDLKSLIVAHIVVRKDPTINNAGVLSPTEFRILSNGTGSASNVGGSIKEDFIILPRLDVRSMLRITNTGNQEAKGFFAASWFEEN